MLVDDEPAFGLFHPMRFKKLSSLLLNPDIFFSKWKYMYMRLSCENVQKKKKKKYFNWLFIVVEQRFVFFFFFLNSKLL